MLNSSPSLFYSLLVFTQLKCQNLANFKQTNKHVPYLECSPPLVSRMQLCLRSIWFSDKFQSTYKEFYGRPSLLGPTFKLQLILLLSFCPALSHRTCTFNYSSKNGVPSDECFMHHLYDWFMCSGINLNNHYK